MQFFLNVLFHIYGILTVNLSRIENKAYMIIFLLGALEYLT